MKASKENPIYTTFIVTNGTKYDVSHVVTELDFSEQTKEMAKRVNISLMNYLAGDVHTLSMVNDKSRVFVYADDGTKKDEVFRGFVWGLSYKSGLSDREITLKCYDHLVFFQESEESVYISPGRSTSAVFSELCGNWGVKLSYQYSSITHDKLVLRGTLSDIFTSDLLDLVQERTGKKWLILSEKDTMIVRGLGENAQVYQVLAGKNAISTETEWTKDGMVTKVKILGKAGEDDRQPVEATLSRNTDTYGTMQKVLQRDENTALADAQAEADGILKQSSTPSLSYQVQTVDIPWVRKGDKVLVNAGDIKNATLIVVGVERSISLEKKQMTLTLEKE